MGYHQKGSWRHCTSSDVGYTPTTTSGAGAVWGKSNMAFANANAWADLNDQAGARNAGPPQCVKDCTGVDTVTRESIACWVSTALQQSCTSDCLLPERTKLQNIAQRCTPSGLPQCVRDCACVNQAVNPEQRAGFARHVTSTNDACISDSQVVILPKCYSSCPGTDQVLSSGLNCQSLKQWADTLGLTSLSGQSSPWGDLKGIWNRVLRSRRLTEHSCISTCTETEKRGARALAGMACTP